MSNIVRTKISQPSSGQALFLRSPTVADASAVWRLVRDSGVLDLNSPYSYLILCKHFAETCLVAEEAGSIVGFVTAYRPPISPDVIFVWQIGVAQAARGRGVGLIILDALVRQEAKQGAAFLEATVTPSNAPSRKLFRAVARRFDTQCVETPYFATTLFPDDTHEAEELFRIGPFPQDLHPKTD